MSIIISSIIFTGTSCTIIPCAKYGTYMVLLLNLTPRCPYWLQGEAWPCSKLEYLSRAYNRNPSFLMWWRGWWLLNYGTRLRNSPTYGFQSGLKSITGKCTNFTSILVVCKLNNLVRKCAIKPRIWTHK